MAVIFFIGPIIWMLFASLKVNVDIVNVNLFTKPTTEHFLIIFGSNDLRKYLLKGETRTINSKSGSSRKKSPKTRKRGR